jgi:hypothetical protein
MDLTPAQASIAVLAVAAGAIVQSSIGFGASVLAAPIVMLVAPRFVPGPMVAVSLVLTLLVAVRERASIDVRGVGWALVGRLPGTALAVALMRTLPSTTLSDLCAALMLLAVVLAGSGVRVAPAAGTLFGAGIASGIMGTVASVGGPPVALVYQHVPGPTLRGTMASYFIFSSVITLAGLYFGGLFGMRELASSLVLLPGVLIGFAISRWTHTRLDRGGIRPAVLALSAIAALGVLVKHW